MPFQIYDNKLLERYKTICTKIEDLKNIEFNSLPGYDERYIKTELRPYGDKAYTNFRSFVIFLIFPHLVRRWCRMWIAYNQLY